MSDRVEESSAIGITRHAAQAMLRHALDTQPGSGCGLLYGLSEEMGATISGASPVADPFEIGKLISASASGRESTASPTGPTPIGFYRSFPDPDTTTADMLSGIPEPLRDASAANGFLYAAISLCTEGRLEIHAFSAGNGTWHKQALSMLEDNALYQTRPSG